MQMILFHRGLRLFSHHYLLLSKVTSKHLKPSYLISVCSSRNRDLFQATANGLQPHASISIPPAVYTSGKSKHKISFGLFANEVSNKDFADFSCSFFDETLSKDLKYFSFKWKKPLIVQLRRPLFFCRQC